MSDTRTATDFLIQRLDGWMAVTKIPGLKGDIEQAMITLEAMQGALKTALAALNESEKLDGHQRLVQQRGQAIAVVEAALK